MNCELLRDVDADFIQTITEGQGDHRSRPAGSAAEAGPFRLSRDGEPLISLQPQLSC